MKPIITHSYKFLYVVLGFAFMHISILSPTMLSSALQQQSSSCPTPLVLVYQLSSSPEVPIAKVPDSPLLIFCEARELLLHRLSIFRSLLELISNSIAYNPQITIIPSMSSLFALIFPTLCSRFANR